jgi:hypothetical protein
MYMAKRQKEPSNEYSHTPTTLLVALFGCACAFITVESICGDANDAAWQQMNRLPAWQVQMGAVCVGIITFLVFLFVLEFLETQSKMTAWRSSAPWLPLLGLTALATAIHIPIYVVFLIGGSYAGWAYRRTYSVRSSPKSRERKDIAW